MFGGNGSITTAGNVGVAIGAGSELSPGSAAATVGTLSLGLGTGTLDISNEVTGTSQSLLFDLSGATSDEVAINTGALNIGTHVLAFNDFVFNDLSSLTASTYTLFDTNQAIDGSLATSGLSGSLGGGYTGTIGFDNSGQDIVLNVTAAPEPSSYLMMGLGALGLMSQRRRRLA